MRPKLPNVKPIPQKKANSAKSLHPDGIEFNTTLIRWAIWPCTRRWMWKYITNIRTNTQRRDSSKAGFTRIKLTYDSYFFNFNVVEKNRIKSDQNNFS